MQTYERNDLRLFRLVTQNGLRYLVAEFIDEYDEWAMGFFKFSHGMYILVNIPKGIHPSHYFADYLRDILETSDEPILAVPGGYYYGTEYHTAKGTQKDITLIEGRLLEEIRSCDGHRYNLVVSENGSSRIAFIGMFAGRVKTNTQHEYEMWRPTPVPKVILDDDNEMLALYGVAAMVKADFLTFTGSIN
jgi:hypothetical protein